MADAHEPPTRRGMQVALRRAQRLYSGAITSTATGSASVVFATPDAPLLPLGERVELTFAGGPLQAPVVVGAVPVARAEGDFRRYTFDLEASFGARHTPSSPDAPAERRRWLRLSPERPQPVRVEVADGPRTGTLLEGRLADLSHGGLAIVLRASAEAALHAAQGVRCTLRAPGARADETWTCSIRNRQLLGEHLRYGLAFVRAEAAALEPPTFEHFWACAGCHTDRLLAVTHAHCPRCGRARGEARLRFPGWDEVLTAADHPFAGDHRSCRCGASWAATAHHCGRCGAGLSP